jgi:hypothetical protein
MAPLSIFIIIVLFSTSHFLTVTSFFLVVQLGPLLVNIALNLSPEHVKLLVTHFDLPASLSGSGHDALVALKNKLVISETDVSALADFFGSIGHEKLRQKVLGLPESTNGPY